jgi:class 3 adenylate cyclase
MNSCAGGLRDSSGRLRPPGPRRRYNERWPRSRRGDRRCAIALRDQLRGIEVRIRAGLHVGEVERRDDDVGGMAVHIAARVMAAAQPDEMLAPGPSAT